MQEKSLMMGLFTLELWNRLIKLWKNERACGDLGLYMLWLPQRRLDFKGWGFRCAVRGLEFVVWV